MKHYGFSCWLRGHRRGWPDWKESEIAGFDIYFCATCARRAENSHPQSQGKP